MFSPNLVPKRNIVNLNNAQVNVKQGKLPTQYGVPGARAGLNRASVSSSYINKDLSLISATGKNASIQ